MSNDRDMELLRYEATLRRQEMSWQAHHDRVLHYDKATVDIGIGALKTSVLVNAGSIVALLAFVGQIWNKDEGRTTVSLVINDAHSFVWGLVASGAAFLIAYLYSSSITAIGEHHLHEISETVETNLPSQIHMTFLARVTAFLMMLCGVVSFVTFCCGALSVIRDLG